MALPQHRGASVRRGSAAATRSSSAGTAAATTSSNTATTPTHATAATAGAAATTTSATAAAAAATATATAAAAASAAAAAPTSMSTHPASRMRVVAIIALTAVVIAAITAVVVAALKAAVTIRAAVVRRVLILVASLLLRALHLNCCCCRCRCRGRGCSCTGSTGSTGGGRRSSGSSGGGRGHAWHGDAHPASEGGSKRFCQRLAAVQLRQPRALVLVAAPLPNVAALPAEQAGDAIPPRAGRLGRKPWHAWTSSRASRGGSGRASGGRGRASGGGSAGGFGSASGGGSWRARLGKRLCHRLTSLHPRDVVRFALRLITAVDVLACATDDARDAVPPVIGCLLQDPRLLRRCLGGGGGGG